MPGRIAAAIICLRLKAIQVDTVGSNGLAFEEFAVNKQPVPQTKRTPHSFMADDVKLREAAEVLNSADALLITAGAGMGVDSGLPDFRGKHGFWNAYPALAKLGLSFEEMANPSWFASNPRLAWAFYGHRLNLYRSTVPHGGFNRLLAIGQSKSKGCFVFTSNVDGQFQKAGFAPDRIVECHGSIHHLQCTVPCSQEIWDATEHTVGIEQRDFLALEPLPKCSHCSALARPNILMFGDWLWLDRRMEAQKDRFARWLDEVESVSAKFVVLELGAGGALPTVRRMSEGLRERFGGRLIRINPHEDTVPRGEIGLACGAAEGIQRICDFMGGAGLTPY